MPDILKDKTNKVLTLMSLPISIGMLSTFLFQVIDTYFIGQLGAESLAALSFSSTIYFILISLYIGFSIGVSIIVGKAAGAGNFAKLKMTTWVSILLSLTISVFLSFLSIVLLNPFFTILGANEFILPMIREYTIPILVGMPLLTVGITISGILRASGNVTKPEVVMGIAGIINLVFDYALIFGKFGFPEMGIAGAAYATVLSWIFVFIGMFFLLIKDRLLTFFVKSEENILDLIQEIFKLGLPTIVTQVIGPITIMFLTFLLARQTPMAVAAFGVASRIEMLLMIGILAVSTAITPFIAQNFGANEKLRIDEAIKFGGKASTYLGVLIALILFLFIRPIAGIFSDNEMVIEYTSTYFYMVSLSYVPYAFFIVTTAIFNGLQQTIKSLRITLVKSFLFTIPLTLFGSIWGVKGIFIGLALANLLAGFYAAYVMRQDLKQAHSSLENTNISKDFARDFQRVFRK